MTSTPPDTSVVTPEKNNRAAAPSEPGAVPDQAPTPAWWKVWKTKPAKPKRPLLLRLFGIGLWGAFKLVMLCILVGFVLLAMNFDPADPAFDMTDAIGAFLKNLLATARWAITNFWKPALAGASIVLPVWVLWRLATLPFRR